jgi:hypothetical protein
MAAKFHLNNWNANLSRASESLLYVIGYSVLIFVALFQRFSLAMINREANDNHYEVMEMLSQGLRSLTMKDCHECFHPKLYYISCVIVFRLFGIDDRDSQIVVAQLVNCFAGAATLGILWRFLQQQSEGRLALFFTFAWLALNPRFLSLNGQASNDSFSVLFSTLAIVATYRLLKHGQTREYFLGQLGISLAILSKGTSWPAATAVLCVLFSRALFQPVSRLRFGVFTLVSAMVCVASIGFGDYDFESYDKYANLGKESPLHFYEQTVVGRPGVTSVVDAYMTFQFVSLLQQPFNAPGIKDYPFHRTSVWTQLYGRLHCAQFHCGPKSWETDSAWVANVNRAIFLFAMLWMILFLIGLYSHLAHFIRSICVHGLPYLARGEQYLPLLVAFAYIAFIIKFTSSYRDFAAMNPIYILPGIVGFTAVLQRGLCCLVRFRTGNAFVGNAIFVGFVVLLILYAINIEQLVGHLT